MKTSHRGRRRIPAPVIAAGAVFVVVSLGGIASVEATRHDPVRVVPVGSISPLPSPTPPAPSVRPVRICLPVVWTGGLDCTTQDARRVVDGSAVTR